MEQLYNWWKRQKEVKGDEVVLYSPHIARPIDWVSPLIGLVRYLHEDVYVYEGVMDVDVIHMEKGEGSHPHYFLNLLIHHPLTIYSIIVCELEEDKQTGYWCDFTSDELGVLLKVLPGPMVRGQNTI